MSRIPSSGTAPERAVRSLLFRLGLRFRLNVSGLPGRPDIVLPRWGTVVFVHGCFWHRHPGCAWSYSPKSRVSFWAEKFAANVARDARAQRELRRAGWRYLVVWECEVANEDRLRRRLRRLFPASGPDTVD